MIFRIASATALLLAPVPAFAQSQQDELDARYDRALAAGYKALFLCGAIANAERNGVNRPVTSVTAWELTGVYPAIDPIVRTLDHRIVRAENGPISHVEVDWAEDMPPRFAKASYKDGCRLAPIGLAPGPAETDLPPNAGIPENFPRLPDGAPAFPPKISLATHRRIFAGPVEQAFDGTYGEGARTTAVVIRHEDGGFSRYAGCCMENAKEYVDRLQGFSKQTPQRTWSVAKSIAATLVGVAVHKGQVAVSDPAVRDAWSDDARKQITIDQLLRMASGRYSDTPGNRTDPLYAGGSTIEETATDWPLLYPPGTTYRYANNDTLMAIKAISDRHEDFDPEAFFQQIGMKGTVAETDWSGDYILSSQVWATAEDLANLGQLYLNDGVWEGERILPEGWTEYVSSPSGPQPDGAFGYGAGFWLFNKSDGIPPDTFAAMGNRGQYLVIVPSRDVVIVRRGEDPVGSRFDIVSFTRDVLAALAGDTAEE
uniref:serine hydrolase domain-containing protein n=1 Tax=Parerythrobacter lutipelagi TaxID=1964208 RepID=UPI0010F5D6A3|nr:serine hydrolase [Parerythrobacter lutipelagi]